jgi:hypothetical protein
MDPEVGGISVAALAVSLNGDLIGNAATNDATTLAGGLFGASTGACSVTCQRRVTLATGDTLQPVAAAFGAVGDLIINGLTMSVLPSA